MSNQTEARLVELESQIARNQMTIEELSDVVLRQGKQIDLLKREIEVLGREILRATEGEAGPRIGAAG